MYQHISKYYNQIFPKNEKLHQFVLNYAKKNANAIDLGCGTGRLVHDLFLYPMNVLGIDLDHSMIDFAKNTYPDSMFKSIDMIGALKDEQMYQLMTCIGNTLPHLNQIEINNFFSLVKKRLSKDGFLIIQLLNYDLILRKKPSELPIIKNDEFIFKRLYHYDEKHILFQTVLETSFGTTEDTNTLYPYRKKDLIRMFDLHGFTYEFYDEKLEVIKDLDHTHYTIVLRHKKDEN